jgi:hypothetical protein
MKRQPLVSVHSQKVFDYKGKEVKEGMTIRIKQGKELISEHKVFSKNNILEYEIHLKPNGIMSCFLSNINKSLTKGQILTIRK